MKTRYPGPRARYAGPYKTLERAEAVLEDCYAEGTVCEGERPDVERIRGHWYVTVADNDYAY